MVVASCWRRRPCDGLITELAGVRRGEISARPPSEEAPTDVALRCDDDAHQTD